ncbi:hypothetical protein VTN77DRAFT_5943 [Rasamsonia byssochlamydoides]|uniref:uncharacterized protein n=1 Tax=Rasamsonia byssochlamydoides TaxID=89139 RepID=UPI003742961E
MTPLCILGVFSSPSLTRNLASNTYRIPRQACQSHFAGQKPLSTVFYHPSSTNLLAMNRMPCGGSFPDHQLPCAKGSSPSRTPSLLTQSTASRSISPSLSGGETLESRWHTWLPMTPVVRSPWWLL